jgi:hypothetical protein
MVGASAPPLYTRSFDGDKIYLLQNFSPIMPEFLTQPGQTIILDKKSFHKSKKISEVAEESRDLL